MPRPAIRRCVALVAAASMVLASGCSSDDGAASKGGSSTTTVVGDSSSTTLPPIDPDSIEGGEQAYIDAFKASYRGTEGSSPLFDEEQADCLAPAWVGIIGLDHLAESGVAPEAIAKGEVGLEAVKIDADTADEMVAAAHDCKIDLRQAVLDSFVPTADLPESLGTCLDEAITDDVADAIFKTRIMGSTEQPPEFADAQQCLTDYEAQQRADQEPQGGN